MLIFSCQGALLNFKINVDPQDHRYYVTPKRKCQTVAELVACHKIHPLRSKQRAGAKIYLLHPIAPISVLPPPWEEFFDDRYNRSYYFNPQTQVTTWERPKSESSHRPSLSVPSVAKSPSSPSQLNVPGARPKSASGHGSAELSSKISTSANTRSKTPGSLRRGPLPEVPTTKNPPSKRGPPALPAKEVPTRQTLPRLPAKEPSSSRTVSEPKAIPPLPPKVLESKSLPRLPPKESALPQLPPKLNDRQPPALPNKEPPLENGRPTGGKPKVYEYEETILKIPPQLPDKQPSVPNGPSGITYWKLVRIIVQ